MIVGLSGGIASGKSTFSSYLQQSGFYVIDADRVARDVVAPKTKGLAQIVDTFGVEFLLSDGQLDRTKLGQVVFSDATLREKLNQIVHPLVREYMWGQASAYVKGRPEHIVVLDIPLLFEGGLHKLADVTVLVYATTDQQLTRLMVRNSMTKDEALRRIHAQMPIEEKCRLADWVVCNTGDTTDAKRLAEELHSQLVELAKRGAMPDGKFDRSIVSHEKIY